LLVKTLKAELKEPDCVEVNWETPLTDSYTLHYQVNVYIIFDIFIKIYEIVKVGY